MRKRSSELDWITLCIRSVVMSALVQGTTREECAIECRRSELKRRCTTEKASTRPSSMTLIS